MINLSINFSADYPSSLIIFCVIIGILYAFFLYRKDSRFEDVPLWLVRSMAIFRFLSITFLAILILNPLIKTIFRDVQKPIIIVAQDNSQSIVVGLDSSFYKYTYRNNLQKFILDISKNFDVKSYSFGDQIVNGIDFTFTDKQTDFSSLFNEIYTRYSNRNLCAIILSSDGIFNKGSNPVYSSKHLNVPVYTVALGDTSVQKDIILSKVNYNRLAYFGNKFPVEVIVSAFQLKNQNTTLIITHKEKTLVSEKINFDNNSFIKTFTYQFDATETGIQRYRINLTNLPDEISFSNNQQDIFIDILDTKQKVLILANSPHPDISALRQTIESNENYQVDFFLINNFSQPIELYNLIILHQIPTLNTQTDLLNKIINSQIPILFIIGTQTSLQQFNRLEIGLNITAKSNNFNESQAIVNKNFVLFNLSDETSNYISKFPPLYTFFGDCRKNATAEVFLYQKIGLVQTSQPLILFNQLAEKKIGIIAGEGFWRWRLHNFKDHLNHKCFNEMFNKIIQYLAVKTDKSFFRVIGPADCLLENEPVLFDAEVYNESYELFNTPEVKIAITSEDGNDFPYTFSKTAKSYHLNAGLFPVGDYKYTATVRIGDKVLIEKGEFCIKPLTIEFINTVADHQLLYQLSAKTGGEMVYPDLAGLEKIKTILQQREDIKPVSYVQKKLKELINLHWLLFIIITFLAVEWFFRKWSGNY